MECVNCGNETGSNSKYCSVACKSKYLRKQHKKQPEFVDESFDESKHESSSPKPPELYTRFDGRKAPLTEAELINEGIDYIKSKLTGKKSSPQPEELVRQPTVTDLAIQRARELNGEQYESYIPSSGQQHTQAQVSTQTVRPQFNLGEAIRSAVSKILPQKKQPEFPDNTYNEWGQALFHWKCLSCNNWISTNEVAIHQADGHKVDYVG